MTVNKVILVGNLGADPETTTTANGTVVAKLRIATSERVKKGENWEDHTEWHRVTSFGRTAENVQQYLSKGRQVYIEGRLRTNKWTDKDGADRWSTEIIAERIHFLGRKEDNGERTPATQGQQSTMTDQERRDYYNGRNQGAARAAAAAATTVETMEDDIPF